MKFYWFTLGTLGVWRITHFLRAEDGPWSLVVRLCRQVGDKFWGKLLDCFYCLSVWIALPPALLLGADWRERLFLWPALSGGAILLQKLSHREPVSLSSAHFTEDPEPDHVLLRQTETTQPTHLAEPPVR